MNHACHEGLLQYAPSGAGCARSSDSITAPSTTTFDEVHLQTEGSHTLFEAEAATKDSPSISPQVTAMLQSLLVSSNVGVGAGQPFVLPCRSVLLAFFAPCRL